jgi:transcriptional regulator with XRE-family HTH domain
MSKAGHKPPSEQSKPLVDFMRKTLSEKGVSLRSAAKEIGIDIAFVSRMLSGENTPNAHTCNLIADYFRVPRVQIYALAGWLEIEDPMDMTEIETLKTLFPEPADQLAIEQIYFQIGDHSARKKYIQLFKKIKSEAQNG